jgi:acylphosphatase
MKERAHILISGWVQGVFFRDQTQKWATSLHLTGWVRNLKDGKVEVVAEGEKESINDLISKLEQGPSLARVDNVDVTWEEYKGEFKDFQITHADLF